MASVNYMRRVEMNDKEKMEMYMKCSKKKLTEMLIAANKAIDIMQPIINIGVAAYNATNTHKITRTNPNA